MYDQQKRVIFYVSTVLGISLSFLALLYGNYTSRFFKPSIYNVRKSKAHKIYLSNAATYNNYLNIYCVSERYSCVGD